MARYLPAWLMRAYCKLWRKFGNREFNMRDSERALKGRVVAIVLSKLRRAGWLDLRMNDEDARKSVYRLNDYREVMKKVIGELGK